MSKYISENESALTLTRQNNATALHNRMLRCTDDLEEMDRNGNTPLLVAAHRGYSACVAELLDFGRVNYRHTNVFGQNALSLATFSGSETCVNMLLRKMTYEEYSKDCWMPPLCVAAMRGHLRLVMRFSAMYPSPEHIRTVHGVDAVTLALLNEQKSVARYLEDLHAKTMPTYAVHGGRARMYLED